MNIYVTVKYLRAAFVVNYHDNLGRAEDWAYEGKIVCPSTDIWCITLNSSVVTPIDLCALMLWGKDHPSTLQPGRIIKSVVRL